MPTEEGKSQEGSKPVILGERPFVLSEALPVITAIVRKVENVDMADFLKDNIEVKRRRQ